MSPLNDTQRERLAALADVLMPAGAGLPAASEVDIHLQWIDLALDVVPMMAPAVHLALEIPGEPADALEQLRQQHPEVFMAFTFILSGAYFMHPRVRLELGYQGLLWNRTPLWRVKRSITSRGDCLNSSSLVAPFTGKYLRVSERTNT